MTTMNKAMNGPTKAKDTPDLQEIQTLKNTADLFQSNYFKFRLDDMLSNIKIDRKDPKIAKQLEPIENDVRRIRAAIETIPAHICKTGAASFGDIEDSLTTKNVSIPLLTELRQLSPEHETLFKDSECQFEYSPPSGIFMVGSYLLGTMMKTQNTDSMNIDVAVQMPSHIFQDKDFRDYRYFHKRALYLAHLALGLKESVEELGYSIEYEQFRNNARTPVIRLVKSLSYPAAEESSTKKSTKGTKRIRGSDKEEARMTKFQEKYRIAIRIIPMILKDTFPLSKLDSNRCNLRKVRIENGNSTDGLLTPLYSKTILDDMLFLEHLNDMHTALKECEALRDTILMGAAWLSRHSFRNFTKFVFSQLALLLINSDKEASKNHVKSYIKIGKSFSSLQMFKVCLQVLATEDRERVAFRKMIRDLHGPSALDIAEEEDAINPQRNVLVGENAMFTKLAMLGAQMSPKVTTLLSSIPPGERECLRIEARRVLRSIPLRDGFDAVFTRKEIAPYDVVCDITVLDTKSAEKTAHGMLTGEHVTIREELESKLSPLLMKALGDHTMLLRPENARIKHCNVVAELDTPVRCATNSTFPLDNLKLCLNLNPFKLNSEIIQGPPVEERGLCDEFKSIWGDRAELRRFQSGDILQCVEGNTAELVEYLTRKHFGVSISWPIDDPLTKMCPASSPFLVENRSREVLKVVRKLDLPLAINSIIEIGESLRDTQISPQQQADIFLEMESSPSWPQDPESIIALKLAFCCKIAEQFKSLAMSTLTSIADANAQVCTDGFVELTVKFKSGSKKTKSSTLMYRAFIVVPDVDTEIENVLTNVELQRRRYTAWFGGVIQRQVQFTPLLTPLIRLTKKWLSSQMVLSYFPTESIESICLHIMELRPWNNLTSAFKRVVSFFANPYEIDIIVDKVTPRVPVNPSQQSLWISTDRDIFSQIVPAPISLAMKRIKSIAQRLMTLFTNEDSARFRRIIDSQLHDAEIVATKFFTPILDYDILIRLDPKAVSFSTDSKVRKSKFANLQKALDQRMELVDRVDASQRFVIDLAQLLHTTLGAYIFWDRLGGDVIGVVFDPSRVKVGKNKRSKLERRAKKLQRLFNEDPLTLTNSLAFCEAPSKTMSTDNEDEVDNLKDNTALDISMIESQCGVLVQGDVQVNPIAKRLSQKLSGVSEFVVPACSEGFPIDDESWQREVIQRIGAIGAGFVKGIAIQSQVV